MPSPAVTLRVDAASPGAAFELAWCFFGYDEPNHTYAPHGRKLLGELAALSSSRPYIRAHNLLTSGDGTPALKWGSTNAYTEDAQGHAVYDWTILDRIFDAYRDAAVRPLVEIGFMPEALSRQPQPYRHHWPAGPLFTGWAHPPKDLGRWAELVERWVRHSVERYGRHEVETWLWEVWNEPDIGYWQGTPEEYFALYDFAAEAVKRALLAARIGGPHTTGPRSTRAADFLRRFLEHCARGKNAATGQTGAPLDFIAFHAKGETSFVDGQVRMGIAPHLQSVARGFEIVASFPEWRHTPVILGESDPEGAAALSAAAHPANGYRNGPQYPAYTAAVYARILDLAARQQISLLGVVTWAFEFEGQPYFAGFRSLATNGIDKPILNLFRMLGLMSGTGKMPVRRLPVASDGAADVEQILKQGVQRQLDVNGLAARRGNEVSVLVWNYHDDDLPAPATRIHLAVEGLPRSTRRVLRRHYRIDERHSNAFTAWRESGSPQVPSPDQYALLETAGQLASIGSPGWRPVARGQLELDFDLPRQAVSLIQLGWP